MPFITTLLKNNLGTVKLLGYGFLILTILGYVGYSEYKKWSLGVQVKQLNIDLSEKEKARKEAVVIANKNANKAKELKTDFDITIKALQNNHKKEIKKVKSLTRIKTNIKEVKPEDDKKVSKVTINTLNELRKLQEARKDNK